MQDIVPKFKFKSQGTVINSPQELESEFIKLGFNTSLNTEIKNKDLVIFVNNKTEFLNFLQTQLTYIELDAVLWFAYPKLSSGIKTDINRDILAALGETFGQTTVSAISINTTWSGLRFRPIEKVGK